MSKEKLKNKNHGITLIALIITVIVLLILVGVTLSVTLGDNGLVNKAKEAALQMEIEQDRELLLSAVTGAIGINGLVDFAVLDNNLPAGFTGSNGTYTSKNGHTFNVGLDGAITYVGGEDNPESSSEDLELLRRYFLGEVDEATGERPGNDLLSLIENPDIFIMVDYFENVKFINNNIISDASDTLSIKLMYPIDSNDDDALVYCHLKYKNNTYILVFEVRFDNEENATTICKSIDALQKSELNLFGTYSDDRGPFMEIKDENTFIGMNGDYAGQYNLPEKVEIDILSYVIDETNEYITFTTDGSWNRGCTVSDGKEIYLFNYLFIYENEKVVNKVLYNDYDIYWQNDNGIIADLEGMYVNATGNKRLVLKPEEKKIQIEHLSSNGITWDSSYSNLLYLKINGQYWIDDGWDSSIIIDENTLVFGGETYIYTENIGINYSLLETGDTITGYNPTSYTSSNPYTVSLAGCSGAFYPENFTWNVTAVSGNTITMKADGVTTGQLSLTGANGWNNSLTALNNIVSEVYAGNTSKYSATARSINFADLGVNISPTNSSYVASTYGSNNKFPISYLTEYQGLTNVTEDTSGCGYASNSNITVMNTSFLVTSDNLGTTNLEYLGTPYWVDKKCVVATSTTLASFSVGWVNSSMTGTAEAALFDSSGVETTQTKSIRPVVTLTINDWTCLDTTDGANWTITNE